MGLISRVSSRTYRYISLLTLCLKIIMVDLAEAEADNAAEMRELDKQENDLLEKLLLPNSTEISNQVDTEENDDNSEIEQEDQVQDIEKQAQEKKRAWQDEDDLDESKKL